MLRDAGASNLPPPALLEAIRQPRRAQLRDPCVKALLAEWRKWRKLGFQIEYVDLWKVAAILGVEHPDAKSRRKIVAAVEAAGIEIHNFDGFRQWLADTNIHVQLAGDAMIAIAEEARWRDLEEWDNRPPPSPPPQWVKEIDLDREYGPTPERYRSRMRALQGGALWFLSEERPS
jgi:hypothetical protein